MTATQTETLLKTESKQEAEAVMELLKEMTPAQKSEMLIFMQGVRFANALQVQGNGTNNAAAVQTI